MKTALEFEVIGSTVQELRAKAEEVAKKAAGNGSLTLHASSPAEPDEYVDDSTFTGPRNQEVFLWKQSFKAVVDFE